MPYLLLASTIVTLALGAQNSAEEWPQYLGPERNGVYSGPRLAEAWGEDGPQSIWEIQVGEGFSGPVVADDRLILFHRVMNREIVEAFDPATGESLWQYAYPTTYRDDFGFDEGPRAVPVVRDGIVYTFGAQGRLHAIDVATGEVVWDEDTMQRFGVPKGFFGAAGSPLVEDGRVLVNVGGRNAGIVAFHARTGEVLWMATEDEASYSSPVGATIAGRRYTVFLTRDALLGLDPATGEVRFRQPWRARNNSSVNAASPIVIGNLIFVSAEYGPGAAVLRLDSETLVEVWSSNDVLTNHYATSVYHDGYLYGYHGRQEFGPSLRAVEFRTGRVAWSIENFRAGSITLAGDRLVILRESGELVLAEASPDAFRPIASAQLLAPVLRAYPALVGGFLFIRNQTTLAAFDLRAEAER